MHYLNKFHKSPQISQGGSVDKSVANKAADAAAKDKGVGAAAGLKKYEKKLGGKK